MQSNPIRPAKIAYPDLRRSAGIGERLRRASNRSKRKTLRTHRKMALTR